MNYTARIRRNADGRIAEYKGDCDLPDKEDGFFIWEEGNYACDCNRHLFFSRVIDGVEPTVCSVVCGDTAYSVLDITFENGDVYFPDGKEP